jgi:catechol 2,3-dioxygenase-like lactoylglutathione lyase family enzyme
MSQPGGSSLSVVLLLSNDPDRTAGFYRDLIGIPLEAEEHGGRRRHYGGVTGSIYFTVQYTGDIPGPRPDALHDSLQLCFSVPDLQVFLQHLEKHGVQPLHVPRPFEHTTFVTLRDPDGRTVRVMTPWK